MIYVSRKQTFLTSTFCYIALATFYNFTRPEIFAGLFGHIVKFLTSTFYKNALNLNTFGLRVHPQIVTCDLLHYLRLYRNNRNKTYDYTGTIPAHGGLRLCSVQQHVELHNIYQDKLHVEASCFHRIL